ncbi:tRNA (adenosine(37)-N6)-threonylcarbamoyltransferase complex ATPase subunit type 1 TsaE [Novosphingobium decolorationis]|uniref:tRNA threonylcarbamoyladenosine biosynthesis protein TsaE n=1 Tax=Novosphingobium decolorationis TaxID=2698673 RepID=A0ABX8E1K0_9SPHN|nr:tRNA (adenosine(37)-N6)-threonylcarbamoyltransferase complex ATPase subunit type 1 TsaE [Novosphingobium decolorationis]MED5545849.1 tRNA (adenosine(37)-N6)-threonylcarbamoyltransferase complex ATPase subunit type 1 TsaE [Pseudomonadota bacterium]QVM83017.1 tRNA (adenosine(37)-N6)-threonylcarbamoyltransferase complex ATPase subunit type 1 TsaE [Novosphingobium decolorationis]
MTTTLELPDLAAMERLGRTIAEALRPGDVVALEGGLGAGKTTLARAIVAGLGHEGEVPSPSFAIIEVYEPGPDGTGVRLPLVHADFYRLEHPDEAYEIGLEEYREGAALIAEWPDHAGGFEHEPACLTLALEVADAGRIAIARGGADWLGRMPK